MKKVITFFRALATTACCCFLVTTTTALGGAGKPVDSRTTFAADALSPFLDSGELPGAISVFYDNGVQETACLGYADVDAKRPVTMDDFFMQCSQTKGFCGVTVAILVEEGKLSLDDPVSKYLPEFKEIYVKTPQEDGSFRLVKAKNTLTVRMVMNHTGGYWFDMPNYKYMGGWSRRMPLRSVAAAAAAYPVDFEPGTDVQYSNVGIDIGAAVVEVVAAQPWEDFLAERVFTPLGMKDSTFRPTDAQLARKIELYDVKAGEKARWRSHNASMQRPYGDSRVFASAGAGLWTTANDQLKFYKMLMNLGVGDNGVRILKEETVKSLLAVSTRKKGLEGYSLGLYAPETDSDDAWFGHGGAWGTDCAVNWHRKQLRLWVVQHSGSPMRSRPWRIPRIEAAERFFAVRIDGSGADAYTGRMK